MNTLLILSILAGVCAFLMFILAGLLRCPKCGGWHDGQDCDSP